MSVNKYCVRPFEEIEIHQSGEVYTCCPNWNNYYSIGNIFNSGIDEVWNSEKAQELRKRVMNKDYSLCNTDVCSYLNQPFFLSEFNTVNEPVLKEYPKVVRFCYDYECNIACSICRKEITKLSDEHLEFLNSKIDTFLLPILKSAKYLIINSAGDPFGSRHSRLVIQKAAEKYPDLKFEFHTNGILCDEANLRNLNITPKRISKFRISIHAASARTYGKIIKNGAKYFPKIIENLEYLKKIKEKSFFVVYIHFVITKYNYKEMPNFVKLAEKVNAIPCFWEYRSENCSYNNTDNNYLYKPEHPLHKSFLKVLKNPILLKYKENISPVILNLIMQQQNK